MNITLYNTMTSKKEEFKPINEGKVGMYVCGVTVYDYTHIGHGRSSVAFDVIRRYFEYCGYDVTFVKNFTDVDDKIINRANENNELWSELALRFIKEHDEEKLIKDINAYTNENKNNFLKYGNRKRTNILL